MRRVSVLIVGAGFAGLGMAIRLRQAGVDDFVMLERERELGGVWRDNRYPGVACDVPAHLYSYSFEPNPFFSRFFAPQAEILAYLAHCATKYGIESHLRLGAGVVRAVFDEARHVWLVEAADGSRYEARVLVCASGLALTRPIVPDIPGLASFGGKVFHSARWDDDYPLAGRNVAVIGTGASAIQIVPAIAPEVARLSVFQRTPPWVTARPDQAISPAQQDLFRRWPLVQKLVRWAIYAVLESMAVGFVVDPRINALRQRLALRFLAKSVRDPALRAKLTPSYTLGCKRILLSSEYYPALQRPNVELVTDAIREVHGGAIVTADGKERPVDAIACATGFEAAETSAPFELRGTGGRTLEDLWCDGVEAYLGAAVAGLPNFFFLVGPNTGLGHNSMIYMMESQIAYVLSALDTMREKGLARVEVRADVQRRYNDEIQARLEKTVWNRGGCVSWYRTKSGKNTTLWPGFTFAFRARTRRFDVASYDTHPA